MTFSIDRALDMAVRHDFFRQASVFFYLVLTLIWHLNFWKGASACWYWVTYILLKLFTFIHAFPDSVEKFYWFQQAHFQNLKFVLWPLETLVSFFKNEHVKNAYVDLISRKKV